jgi:2,5-diamino-6-(ribosylamino)-4(3H)-pyrimidinone 5'-phosphate reductase
MSPIEVCRKLDLVFAKNNANMSKPKPYVICHMIASIDGRIVLDNWDVSPEGLDEYDRTGSIHRADAWMCGRITMESFASKARLSAKVAKQEVPRTDFIATRESKSYAIAIDPSGKIYWKSNHIDSDHIIAVLTEEVSSHYLAFLQSKKVSYLFGGKAEIDLGKVLEKLTKEFKIKKLLLEGGGKINGTMLTAGLIDEISLLVAPVADATMGAPTLFDVEKPLGRAPKLALLSTRKIAGGILWLRYKVHPAKTK